MKLLTTKRTILRSFKETDLKAVSMLMSDLDVMRTTGFKAAQDESQTRILLKEWIAEKTDPFGVWGVFNKVDHELIGWAMLKNLRLESPELGYMIVKKFWRQGFAKEISKRIIDYAFDDLKKDFNIKSIRATADSDNIASIKVLESLKMTEFNHSKDLSSIEYILKF